MKIIRILMPAFVLVACSKTTSWETGQRTVGISSSSNTASSDGAEQGGSAPDDDKIVDAPVPVGGTYLVCATDYQGTDAAAEQSYGCRLNSNNKKVAVPASASAQLRFFAGSSEVDSTTSLAASDSPWTWLVHTSARGPFTAELTLRNVEIQTVPELVVTAGSSSYVFNRAVVEGSTLALVVNGGVAPLTLAATQTVDLVPIAFSSAFPKLMKSSTLAYGSMRGGFTYANGREITCLYRPSVVAPKYYEFAGSCLDAGASVTLTLESLIAGASAWTVSLIDQTGAPASFAVESAVREFK